MDHLVYIVFVCVTAADVPRKSHFVFIRFLLEAITTDSQSSIDYWSSSDIILFTVRYKTDGVVWFFILAIAYILTIIIVRFPATIVTVLRI